MSSGDLYAIGTSGLRAFRAQMGAISENIANASSEGYNRRTVTLRESSVSAVVQPLYISRADFGGTEIEGTVRANDPYLDATARQTGMSLASANTRLRWLTDIETALSDDTLGVGGSLSTMFGAIDRLAASPSDTALRTNMIYGIEQVVTAFHNSSNALNSTLQGAFTTAQGSATTVNDSLNALARINDSLLRSQPGTSAHAQLLDSRDVEVAKITQVLNVSVSFDANQAAVISYNGQNVLQGQTAGSFAVTQNANGTLALELNGASVAAPTDGSLGGLFISAGIARQRLDSLDALAVQFAGDMNTWHGQGRTDAGAAGGALVSVGTTAASLTLVISSASQIAAATSDGRLNGNLIDITSVRGAGSVEQGWTNLVTAHGSVLNTTKTEAEAALARDNNARAARDKVSGVDLDAEAADLLRVQQAYQAAAKVIQSAKQIVDTILQLN